ncbi:MAG: BatD family protein [Bacteroidales bacterium]|nr:BatD family protein [Bacteroidales bacterium]MCF8344053.1 BatD family protein [Bacteroidales bacterium]MCF8351143.1 BatD family protein [Bacteroidales bacterium]MCF8376608.1 BatD family protein [Bacteroidales bacterium]MCF8400670.1 BatD family protein [Bacteroidales bacterium]
MKKTIVFIGLLIFTAASMLADEVKFTASATQVVEVGERFQLTYEVNAEGSNFRGPDFGKFRYLSGPYTSVSQSTSIINGKVTQNFSKKYIYTLQALDEGEFTIAPATIRVEGKEYQSNAVKIKVVAGQGGKTKSSPQAQQPQRQPQMPKSSASVPNAFIDVDISNSKPFVGEQLIATYNLYYRLNITRGATSKHNLTGFFVKVLKENNNINPETVVTVDGVQYYKALIKQVALFPQKSGAVTINPLEFDCRVEDWFNYQVVTIKSDPVKINVSPLPLTNKPASFSGAVGYFDISASVDKTELKANDALTYKIRISGKGNLELIGAPELRFPADFEVYDPKISNNIELNPTGISGTRTFEYLIVPRNHGTYNIPQVSFACFNPANEEYINLQTKAFTIKVEKSDRISEGITYSGVSQDEVELIGQDIRHIMQGPYHLQKVNSYFFNSLSFYLWAGIPFVIALIMVFLVKRRQAKRKNTILLKNRRATKVARNNLKKARQFLQKGDDGHFYIEISTALWGYIGDKFNIPRAKLSRDTVHEKLAGEKVGEATIDQFIQTLDHTEYARFAPGESASRMQEIYQEALTIISKIEQELK